MKFDILNSIGARFVRRVARFNVQIDFFIRVTAHAYTRRAQFLFHAPKSRGIDGDRSMHKMDPAAQLFEHQASFFIISRFAQDFFSIGDCGIRCQDQILEAGRT